MQAYKTLYKSAGLPEWKLLRAEGRQRFPARMMRHRLFYPALGFDLACQLASEWHPHDPHSEYCGVVIAFDVPPDTLCTYEDLVAEDAEANADQLWLTPDDAFALNAAIIPPLRVCEVYYGSDYTGPRYTPLELSDDTYLL